MMIDKTQINTVEKKYDAITNTVVNYKVTTTDSVEIFVPLVEDNTDYQTIQEWVADGNTITDNGGGIPLNVQSRIFEPFFTTKEVGVGTGQGLAIAHNVIVKSHQGQIWFESKEGEGTTFFIKLPM